MSIEVEWARMTAPDLREVAAREGALAILPASLGKSCRRAPDCSWLMAGLSEKAVIPSSPQRPKCHVAEGSDCNQPQGHASTRTSKKVIAIEETGKLLPGVVGVYYNG